MRVLVMGAGGVGGYFGARLARVGHEVTFVARGAHLAAMQERGLEVRDRDEVYRLEPTRAVGSPEQAEGAFDLVLFAVKGYDTPTAAAALRPALGPQTMVLTLQNGIDSVDQLNAALGREPVLAGTCRIESTILEPGVIQKKSPFQDIWLNEQAGEPSERVDRLAETLRAAGVGVTVTDPGLVIWDKFIWLAANSSMSAVCRLPGGAIWSVPEGLEVYRKLIEEAVAVARAAGVKLEVDAAEKISAAMRRLPPTMTTSLMRDYERESKVELEQLGGALVRKARELGVPTPTHDVIYAILKARALSFGGI
jgi:2-dehydropantoate 2-reductase